MLHGRPDTPARKGDTVSTERWETNTHCLKVDVYWEV